MQRAELDAALLAAHASGDKPALIGLYAAAADMAGGAQARAFYLTQAYVFALDCGAPEAADLRARLIAMRAEAA